MPLVLESWAQKLPMKSSTYYRTVFSALCPKWKQCHETLIESQGLSDIMLWGKGRRKEGKEKREADSTREVGKIKLTEQWGRTAQGRKRGQFEIEICWKRQVQSHPAGMQRDKELGVCLCVCRCVCLCLPACFWVKTLRGTLWHCVLHLLKKRKKKRLCDFGMSAHMLHNSVWVCVYVHALLSVCVCAAFQVFIVDECVMSFTALCPRLTVHLLRSGGRRCCHSAREGGGGVDWRREVQKEKEWPSADSSPSLPE